MWRSAAASALLLSLSARPGGVSAFVEQSRSPLVAVHHCDQYRSIGTATFTALHASTTDADEEGDEDESEKPANPYADPNYPELEFVNYDDPNYTIHGHRG